MFFYTNKIKKFIAIIKVQITRQLTVNMIIYAAKKVIISFNSVSQISLRLNYLEKADIIFLF